MGLGKNVFSIMAVTKHRKLTKRKNVLSLILVNRLVV